MKSLDGYTDEQLVAQAKKLYAEAEKVESQADSLRTKASEKKWDVADRCYALVEERGWSQTKTGKAIGMSQRNVSRYVAMVTIQPVPANRPAFGEVYAEVDPDASTLSTYRRHTAALAQRDPEGAASIVADHAAEAVAKTARRRSVSGHIARDREALGRVTDAALRRGKEPVEGAEGLGDLRDALSQVGRSPADDVEPLVVRIEEILSEDVPTFVARFAGVEFSEGEGDGPNALLFDRLADQKARIDAAFRAAGVGQSIQDALGI